MTYILGLKYKGFTSIISDSRISSPNCASNSGLKVGILFPGCIYGISGSSQSGRQFIQDARLVVGHTQDVQENWDRFMNHASKYSSPPSTPFKVLLSSRATGTPILYVFDSLSGLKQVVVDEGWFSIGSGGPILDPFIDKLASTLHKWIHQETLGALYPYVFCLRLSELSLSFEKQKLHEADVGGAFHFLYQTQHNDATQKPALYIITAADRKRNHVIYWYYRLLFIRNSLVIHKMIPQNQTPSSPGPDEDWVILLDTAASPEYISLDGFELDELRMEICAESDLQPLYFFCGFGFVSPSDRTSILFHVTTEGKFVVNREAYANGKTKSISVVCPRYQQAIVETLETSSSFDSIGPATIEK